MERDKAYRAMGVEPGPLAWYWVKPGLVQALLLALVIASPVVLILTLVFLFAKASEVAAARPALAGVAATRESTPRLPPAQPPDESGLARSAFAGARASGRSSAQPPDESGLARSAFAGARASGRSSAQPPDESGLARSRIDIAKKLIDIGKYEDARGWLRTVLGMRTDPAIAEDARGVLAKINGLADSPRGVTVLGGQTRAGRAAGQIARPKPRYYAQIIAGGPIRSGQIGARVLVLGSPDNPRPVGTAYEIGSDDQGLAEWTLNVRNAPVPGIFVIVDREFRLTGK